MNGLEFVRVLHDMQVQTLADKLGISRGTMSQWTHGKTAITKDKAEKLKEIFPDIPSDVFSRDISKSEQLELKIAHYKRCFDQKGYDNFELTTMIESAMSELRRVRLIERFESAIGKYYRFESSGDTERNPQDILNVMDTFLNILDKERIISHKELDEVLKDMVSEVEKGKKMDGEL